MSDSLVAQLQKEYGQDNERGFLVQPVPESDNILQVVFSDQEEFPINVTEAEGELICLVRLFSADEVAEGKNADMHEDMLSANLALPLSTFGKIGDDYVLFGALSAQSRMEMLLEELDALASNTLEALELVSGYLK